MADLTGKQLDALINTDAPPYCPKCGSLDGSLGTQGLYFMCRPCDTNTWYCKEAGHDLKGENGLADCGQYSPFYRKMP